MRGFTMGEVTLRTATQQDAGFLYDLRKTTMKGYITQIWGWDEPWERAYFEATFRPWREQIIELAGEEAGVLSVERKSGAIHLTRIYILPEYQGRGIGTYLIRTVLDLAFHRGLPVILQVLKINPAKELYKRLGFVVIEETLTHYTMRATPPSATSIPAAHAAPYAEWLKL